MRCTNMKLICLIFLAVMSVFLVTECKPLSEDVKKAPCVDCAQKNFRRKRSYQFVFTEPDGDIELNSGCSCNEAHEMLQYTMTILSSLNGNSNIYIGNGKNNENHVVVNGANNVYIGNGDHNTNHVTING